MRTAALASAALTALLALAAATAADATPLSADSLAPGWRAEELRATNASSAGEAALALGQLHYMRGEYRQATSVLSRAAARLSPERKPEARYWSGLAWLALREPGQARAALDEVARAGGPLRGPALLAIAYAWEADDLPERALEALVPAISRGGEDVAPAALERYATIADRLHRTGEARNARARLLRENGGSLEAARIAASPSPASVGGTYLVQAGAFVERPGAEALALAAYRSGFTDATVVGRRGGKGTRWVVMLGGWPSNDAAVSAAARASQSLGVRARVVRP